MNFKKYSIIAILVIAATALGYFFINTTAQIQIFFAKVGAITVAVLIVAGAAGAIWLVNKAKNKHDEHVEKKEKRQAMKAKKEAKESPEVQPADFAEVAMGGLEETKEQ